jgi:hypothetical protein
MTMRTNSARRGGAAAALLLAAVGGGLALGAVRQPPPPAGTTPSALLEGKFDGAVSCRKCHTAPDPDDFRTGSTNFVLLTEYAVWKTHDKHAQAYAVLLGPRSQHMGEILGVKVTDEAAGCLNCHAMNFPKSRQGEQFTIEDGVSCGGCHGPSRGWFDDHSKPSWRLNTPAQKEAKGMIDLRDPEKRARLCMSCHVGNPAEGKVVTHAMFAAGHPPLSPIEIASFSHNEPQHWRDAKDVPFFHDEKDPVWQKLSADEKARVRKSYDVGQAGFQQTRLALIGAVVALRETMRLARERASADAAKRDPGRLWPELLLPGEGGKAPPPPTPDRVRELWPDLALAHTDCYACHHDLRVPGYRQERGYGYRLPNDFTVPFAAGRPPVRLWAFALLEPAVRQAARGRPDAATYLQKVQGDLTRRVQELAAATADQPLGAPGRVVPAAAHVEEWCQELIEALTQSPYTSDAALQLLSDLARREGARLNDYESARQVAALFRIAFREWDAATGHRKGEGIEAVRKGIESLAALTLLDPYTGREDRLNLIVEIIARQTSRPLEKGRKEFTEYTRSVGDPRLLKDLADNDFVAALQKRVSNEDLNKELQKPETLQKLQKIGDGELQGALKVVAGFNPRTFRDEVRALAAALEPLSPVTKP